MSTDQTDHRAQADGWLANMLNATTMRNEKQAHRWVTAHLLAAIHDGQAEQTEWLHRIRDLLAVMAEPKGDPCPCGCRRDVGPKPRLAEGGFTGPDDPSAASPMRFHPDDQFLSAEQVRAAGKRAMESIRKKTAVDDFTTKVMSLGPEQGTLDGLLALAAADVPPEQMRRLASDWAAGRLATDPEPASESVTVSLPRDVVERAIREADMWAAQGDGFMAPRGRGIRDDLLKHSGAVIQAGEIVWDAASATQEADQGERVAQAAALREAADSGHVDAASCLWLHLRANQIEREGQA